MAKFQETEAATGPYQQVMGQLQEFYQQSQRFYNRATKPTKNEYLKSLKSAAIALGAMGAVGYAVKLLFLPVVSNIVA